MAKQIPKKTIRQQQQAIQQALKANGLKNFPVTNIVPGTAGKGALGIGTLLPRPALSNYSIQTNYANNQIVSTQDPANARLFFVIYKNRLVPGDDGFLYAFFVVRTLNATTETDVQRMLGSTNQQYGTVYSVAAISLTDYENSNFQHPVYINQNAQPLQLPYAAVQILQQKTPGRLDNIPIGYPDFDSTRSPISTQQGMLPMPPYPNFTTNSGATAYVAGATVGFVDTSLTNPTTVSPTGWVWGFTGPAITIPSSSTLQNPIITFGSAGAYTVTLTASNSVGSQSVTKTNYIVIS